jgi:hypothetical protein
MLRDLEIKTFITCFILNLNAGRYYFFKTAAIVLPISAGLAQT